MVRACGLAVAIVLAIAVSGCGVRGSLEAPADGGDAKQKASAESGQGKKEDAALKPHRGFILDGLIR